MNGEAGNDEEYMSSGEAEGGGSVTGELEE